MTRPQVLHDGFFVPNAASVSNPRMAEPDKVDFSTAANARWGVVDHCGVTCSGTTVYVEAGIVVVNGKLLPVSATTTTVDGGMANDRFDLITVNEGGNVVVLKGTAAVDPVFPDVPVTAVLLAAIFCSTTGAYDDNVIDKRKFLPLSLLSKVAATDALVQNRNGSGDYFRVNGDGSMYWANGILLAKISGTALRVEPKVSTAALDVDGQIATGSVVASALVTGANLVRTTPRPATAAVGAFYQDPATGVPSYFDGSAWQAISSADVLLPPGTVITSILSSMPGWVKLDGSAISEATYPRLFALPQLAGFITSGTTPNRTMTLPDTRNRVLMGGQTALATGGRANNVISLTTANMPRHNHKVAVAEGGGTPVTGTTSMAGQHIHDITGGMHNHGVSDPGHAHNGAEYPYGAFIALAWGGANKIDALFNDRNHTYSVEAAVWTQTNTTGIAVDYSFTHPHDVSMSPQHNHSVSVDAVPAHGHAVTEDSVGNGDAFDITPAFITLYVFVKA